MSFRLPFAKLIIALTLMPGITTAAVVSYDASGNTLPAAPFTRFDADFPIVGPLLGFNAGQSVSAGIYQLDTTDQTKYTFWFTSALTLDHTQTVEIRARLKLLSQTSASPTDRAGLGIALTDDRNYYNELYIAGNEIFLNQRSGSTRVRDVAFSMDTTSAFHDYIFRLQGDTITILVDGIQRLAGTIFDTVGLSGVPTLANWASIGDITSSAAGSWQMQSMSVSVVPEPAAGAALVLGSGALFVWWRQLRQRRGL